MIRQRNSIHSTSCALLFISLFPKSTYLCFASFKLSKSRNDEYIYWCHREINRYFCASIKARVSNDGGCTCYCCKYCNSNISSLRYCFKKDYIYHLRKRLYFSADLPSVSQAPSVFIFINILFLSFPWHTNIMGNHFNNNCLYRTSLHFQTHSKRRVKSSPYHS